MHLPSELTVEQCGSGLTCIHITKRNVEKCEKIKIDKSNRSENPCKFRIRKSRKETVAD